MVETGAHRGRRRILHGRETAGSKRTGDGIDIHGPATIPRWRPMRWSTSRGSLSDGNSQSVLGLNRYVDGTVYAPR